MQFPRPLFLLPLLLAAAFAQTDRVELVSAKAGHAEAKVLGVVLHADEATLNSETGELTMRGHVHVTLPARGDHTLVRYGTAAMLTDQPVGLTADRLTVKSGILQASGNIVVVPTDPELSKLRLRGDEIYMFLRIGDGTLRGNVTPASVTPAANDIRSRVPLQMMFPPDIIK